jgi:sterol desaturase/sphingolipid hydroxylase (fatty acid hydroxylase superfamily)
MAWWNVFPLFAIVMSPVILFALVMWLLGVPQNVYLTLFATCAVVSIAYYGMYEYIHWCMHLPRERRLEMSSLFRRLNGHHILHHRYVLNNNFNVVFPFADWLFGTLLLRAKTPFPQVEEGPSVPDLQPLKM